MSSVAFGHLTKWDASSFEWGVGYTNRSFHYHEPLVTSFLIIMFLLKFGINRMFCLKSNPLLYLLVTTKDICYAQMHYKYRFDAAYVTIYMRHFGRRGVTEFLEQSNL